MSQPFSLISQIWVITNLENSTQSTQFVSCSLWGILLDYSKAWIMEIHPCGKRGTSSLGLHEFTLTQIFWVCPLRVSLNFIAQALVTEPTRTWIEFAFHLLVVSSSTSSNVFQLMTNWSYKSTGRHNWTTTLTCNAKVAP